MERRTIGTTELELPVLTVGSWQTYARIPRETGAAMVEWALRSGPASFDVAAYGDGSSEVLLGEHLRAAGARREEFSLIEKVESVNGTLRGQLERSAERLGFDRFDAVVAFDPQPGTVLAALTDEFEQLLADGVIRSWGLCNWHLDDALAAWRHARAAGGTGPQLIELKYGIARRAVVESPEFARFHEESGITLCAADALEGGVLLGRRSADRTIARDPGGIRERIVDEVAPGLAREAERLEVAPATLALAFTLLDPRTTCTVFGASSLAQLQQNSAAAALAASSPADVQAAADRLSIPGHTWDEYH